MATLWEVQKREKKYELDNRIPDRKNDTVMPFITIKQLHYWIECWFGFGVSLEWKKGAHLHCQWQCVPNKYIYLIIGIYCSHNRGQNPHIYSTNKKVEDSSLTKRKHFLGSSALLCVLNKRSHEKLMCAVCVPTLWDEGAPTTKLYLLLYL